jgi:hypothetical protein
MTSLKKYNSIFHDLMDESKNDINGCNAGCTTQEHYLGYLCWQTCEAQYKPVYQVKVTYRSWVDHTKNDYEKYMLAENVVCRIVYTKDE